jgi:hypothetical protein
MNGTSFIAYPDGYISELFSCLVPNQTCKYRYRCRSQCYAHAQIQVYRAASQQTHKKIQRIAKKEEEKCHRTFIGKPWKMHDSREN